MKQFKIIRTMRIYTMFVYIYIYIETVSSELKASEILFSEWPFFRCSCSCISPHSISPSAETRVSHMSETRSRELLGHRTAGQTEVQPQTQQPFLHIGPSALRFQSFFSWHFCSEMCYQFYITFHHWQSRWKSVFICFISTSFKQFPWYTIPEGHSHGIQETKLLAMPNGGAERCQLPCRSLRYF